MTQPAKSQEPSMEEILASIRRIIADDDANKTAPRPAEPPPQAAAPAPAARPAPPPQAPPPAPRVTPPEPSLDEAEAADPEPASEPDSEPDSEPMADVEDQASDILDLTEQMAAPMPQPAPAPKPAPQFRTIDGSFDVSYDEERAAPQTPAPQMSAPQMPEARAQVPSEDNPYRGDARSNLLLSSVTSAAVDSAFNTLAQTVLVQNARTLEDLVREMLRPMLKAWLDDNLPGMVERLVRAEIERVSRGRMG
jgi:cell pole-organizing protein PopZ